MSERLTLRAVDWDDAPVLHDWLNDPIVMHGWGMPGQRLSMAEVRRRIDGWLAQETTLGHPACLIAEAHDLSEGTGPVGVATLSNHDLTARSAELSLAIGERDLWGKGYGTALLHEVLQLAFAQWNLHRVWLRVEAENRAGMQLYERAGLQREGMLRDASYFDGAYGDQVLYAALAPAFTAVVSVLPTLAQDPSERFDVCRADGAPAGFAKRRADVHRDGDWHRAVHVWVAGIDASGEPYLILQRRSLAKDTWPGVLDATVGGHYRAGEALTETLRETEEEIGVVVTLDMLVPLGVRVAANEVPVQGIYDNEMQDVFLLRDDRPLEEFTPHPHELAELIKVPLVALIAMLRGTTRGASGERFAPGDTTATSTVITLADVIPTVDGYCLRIALAAQRVLRGEPDVMV